MPKPMTDCRQSKDAVQKKTSVKTNIITEYDSKIDSKGRFLLRGKKGITHVHVQEFENGALIIEPKYLASLNELSDKTLKMMDKSVKNIKNGKVSPPVNLNEL